jgi:hypothetical protein
VHCRIPHSSVRNFLIAAGTLTAAVYGVRYIRQYSQRERWKALLTHVRCGEAGNSHRVARDMSGVLKRYVWPAVPGEVAGRR